MADLPILSLFKISCYSVLQMLFQYIIGWYMAKRKLLPQKFVSFIFRLSVDLLVPALLFSKICQIMSVNVLKEEWTLFVVPIIHTLIGLGLGYFFSLFLPPEDREYRKHFILGITFGNCGYIVLSLISAICSELEVFAKDPLSGVRGQGYVSIYLVCMTPLMWTIAWGIMPDGPPDPNTDDEDQSHKQSLLTDRSPPPQPLHPGATPLPPISRSQSTISVSMNEIDLPPLSERSTLENQYRSVPTTRLGSSESVYNIYGEGERHSPQFIAMVPVTHFAWKSIALKGLKNIWYSRVTEALLSPSCLAAFAAIFIGLIDPVREALFNRSWPLRPIMNSLAQAGDASIPLANIALGAVLANAQLGTKVLHPRTITLMNVARLLIIPGFGVMLTWGLWKAGTFPKDPVFRLVMLMETCCPVATTMMVFSNLKHTGEQAMSALTFYNYVAFFVLCGPWLTFFLTIMFNTENGLAIIS